MCKETGETIERPARIPSTVDVVVVLLLAVVPDVVNSVSFIATQSVPEYDFTFFQISIVVRSLQVVGPVLLIMHLRRVNWANHGFVRPQPKRDIAVALGLVVAAYIGAQVCFQVAWLLGFNVEDAYDNTGYGNIVGQVTALSIPLIFVSSCANGFAEELIMRAYLIPRIQDLSGSRMVAVITTSLLFSAYHVYQGVWGALSTLVMGVLFGWYFVVARKIWPIAVAHAALDVFAMAVYL